jgi:hypothetical protein
MDAELFRYLSRRTTDVCGECRHFGEEVPIFVSVNGKIVGEYEIGHCSARSDFTESYRSKCPQYEQRTNQKN